MNEVDPPKVRSRIALALKSKQRAISTHALMLDSEANVHIFNNLSFLSCITTCLGKYVNTTGSRTLCNNVGRLCRVLKSLSLPSSGSYFKPNCNANIISLSLLSGTHLIPMDIDVENAFYVHSNDGSYINRNMHNVPGQICIRM